MATDNTIPAVEKTIWVLEYIAENNDASQQELVENLNIPGASCYRIIQSLLKYGWLNKSGNRFSLGQGLLPLSRKVYQVQQWQEKISPLLAALSMKSELSVKLSMREGRGEYATVLREESPKPLSITGRIGAKFPIIEGATGAALVFKCDKKELQRLIDASPNEMMEKQNPDILFDRIKSCKIKGYCLTQGYGNPGIEVISTPIIRDDSVFAALSIIGFTNELNDLKKFADMLAETKEQCEKTLASLQ